MKRTPRFIALALAAAALSACGSKSKPMGPPDPPPPDAGDDAGAGGVGVPPDPDFPAGMFSGTVVGIPGNEFVAVSAAPFLTTYRTFVRSRAPGPTNWVFWMSNAQDSTFGVGPPNPNTPGPVWQIEAAFAGDGGTGHGGAVPGTLVPVTFGGSTTRTVQPGEKFWSDPVMLDLPDGDDLVFTWAVSAQATGPTMPATSAPFLTTFFANGKNLADQESNAGFSASYDMLVAPQLFATDRPISKRLCFLGDSITQGIGSTRDMYRYWVAKIADGLGPDVGVWNLGSGWARAADAASDGFWLWKAKQCDEVAVALGVNDIINSQRSSDQILADLTTILDALKAHNPAVKTILFTIPTFNFALTPYATWKAVNDTILATPPASADRVFDIAAVESQPPPNDGKLMVGYSSGDGHPNDTGSAAIANAFLAWYVSGPGGDPP
jgi:lysophospholipase L1-like esterase